MNDLPSITLLQQQHATPHSGEELEVLGKCAAVRFAEGQYETLNDAVVSMVKSAGLSPEQVRRVIEFANTKAYLTEFNKEGAEHRYVSFAGGPADPAEVLRTLNSGAGGTVFDRGAADYLLEPPSPKQAEVSFEKNASQQPGPSARTIAEDMQGDVSRAYALPGYSGGGAVDPFGQAQALQQVQALTALTGRQPVVAKHASLDFSPEESAFERGLAAQDIPYPDADPLADAYDLQIKLAGAAEHLTSTVFGLESVLLDTVGDLYHQVKQAALEGSTLGQIVAAWGTVVPSEAYVKVAFAEIGPRLIADEVLPSLDALEASLEKTAHRGLVNLEHPVVGAMAAFCLALDKLAEMRGAQEELIEAREQVTSQLLELQKTGGIREAGGVYGLAKRVAGKGGEFAEKAVKGAGDLAVGRGARSTELLAKGVGTAVKYSPQAALGAGAVMAGTGVHDKAQEFKMRRQQRAMMRGGY